MKNDTASRSIHDSVVALEVDKLFPYDKQRFCMHAVFSSSV